MGGGHAPAAPKEGFEGAVRKIIPEDHYVRYNALLARFSLGLFCCFTYHGLVSKIFHFYSFVGRSCANIIVCMPTVTAGPGHHWLLLHPVPGVQGMALQEEARRC